MVIVDFLVSHAIVIVLAGLVLLVAVKSIRIANQYERGVVFRLGIYHRTAGPGIYIVWFLIEWQTKLDLRTVTAAVEQ
ncbi:MAG TPA: slipin family protein, partial [Variovorax sp.]